MVLTNLESRSNLFYTGEHIYFTDQLVITVALTVASLAYGWENPGIVTTLRLLRFTPPGNTIYNELRNELLDS